VERIPPNLASQIEKFAKYLHDQPPPHRKDIFTFPGENGEVYRFGLKPSTSEVSWRWSNSTLFCTNQDATTPVMKKFARTDLEAKLYGIKMYPSYVEYDYCWKIKHKG
jgi:hypothetical protein